MKKPINPYVVLVLAILLPGAGHVAIRQASRGLVFVFFVMLFGVLTYMSSTPDQSFIGRHPGGFFVWPCPFPMPIAAPA